MLKYEKKIREIIALNLKTTININNYNANSDLRNIGMDSISFVSIVVSIENEFGIEFPTDRLLIAEYRIITLLSQTTENIILNVE